MFQHIDPVAWGSAKVTFCSPSKTVIGVVWRNFSSASTTVRESPRQPERGFVQDQNFRLHHQRTSDRQHLLFAADSVCAAWP